MCTSVILHHYHHANMESANNCQNNDEENMDCSPSNDAGVTAERAVSTAMGCDDESDNAIEEKMKQIFIECHQQSMKNDDGLEELSVFHDRPAVESFADMLPGEVLIQMPTLFVSSSEGVEPGTYTNNIRLIQFEDLKRLLTKAVQIEQCAKTVKELNEALSETVEMVFGSSDFKNRINPNESAENGEDEDELDVSMSVIMLLKEVLETTPKMSDELGYPINANTRSISFDPIRKYIVDENKLLKQWIPIQSGEHLLPDGTPLPAFYKALPKEKILMVRDLMDDTDYNRLQFILAQLVRTLTFQSDRMYDTSQSYIILLVLFVGLIRLSKPLLNASQEDLQANYIAVAFDSFMKSSAFSYWARQPFSTRLRTQMLLRCPQGLMSQLLRQPDARSRASVCLECIRPHLQEKGLQSLTIAQYDEYVEITKKIPTDNGKYLYLCLNTLKALFQLKSWSIIQMLVRERINTNIQIHC